MSKNSTSNNYIDLESVGSTLTNKLLVFPIDIYMIPSTASEAEEMMGVHLYDVTDEWYTSLSSDDLTDLFEFVELNSNVVKVIYNEWKTKIWGMWEEVNNCYMNLEAI